MLPQVIVGKKTVISANWKHAIYSHFVRLFIDKTAKVESMGEGKAGEAD